MPGHCLGKKSQKERDSINQATALAARENVSTFVLLEEVNLHCNLNKEIVLAGYSGRIGKVSNQSITDAIYF